MDSSKNQWKYFYHPGGEFFFSQREKYINQDKFPNLFESGSEDELNIIGLVSDNFFGIRGRSLPSDAHDWFMPILEWLEYYLRTKPEKIRVEFWLEYYNTASSNMLFRILSGFEKYQIKHKNIQLNVYWYFPEDDEDMQEGGEGFQSELKSLNFNVIPYDDSSHYEDMQKIFNIEP